MTTPNHPVTGRFTAAAAGLPSAKAVNLHLAAKPDQPADAACAVPDVPDHDGAMGTGAMPLDLPPGPDAASKHVGGPDTGYPA